MTTAIRYHLLLVPPTTVFAARVNQTTFGSAAAQVTFDSVTTGAYSAILPEMLVKLGTSAGAEDLGRARVRKAATSDTLYFGWASRSTGEGEAYLQDDAYITAQDLYKPWTRNPRITSDGTMYTDYDRDFATYGLLPPAIILGCGPATQQPLDAVTDEATFAFDASSSYSTEVGGGSIATWTWTLPAGATVTAGAIDSAAVTFTLPVGAYWVSVSATDANGTVGTRRVLCVAGEPSGTLTEFDQVQITRRPEGQTLRVRVNESIAATTYPNGCMAVLWKTQTANGVAATPSGLTGHAHVCFVGWHYQADMDGRASETGYIDTTTLEFRDVGGWMQVLPGYPLVLENRTTPALWTEMENANIDRYFARLLAEYSNLLMLTDFTWSGMGADYYSFPALGSDGGTLYDQVDGRAQAIAHKLTCDQWGRLAVLPDPQMLDPTGGTGTPITRTATVQKALTEADWSDIQISVQPFPRANWNRGIAVVASALTMEAISKLQAVFCVAPGDAPSQGSSAQQSGEQLVTDQDELNAREGHRYAARMNSPLPSISLTLAGPDDYAIQPAYMTWVTLTTSAATAGQRGPVLTAARLLPLEVTISHDAETASQTVSLTAEYEVQGSAAQTYVPLQDSADVPDASNVLPSVWDLPADAYNLNGKLDNIFLVHADGTLSLTEDFQTPGASGGPTYTAADLSLDGDVLSAVVDPYSPKYLGTGTTVNAWIATTTTIYKVTDVANVSSRVVAAQHTFAAETTWRTIATERGTQNWLIVSSYYEDTGTKACYTTDGGTTWTEVAVSGDVITSSDLPDVSDYDWAYYFDFTANNPSVYGMSIAEGTYDAGHGVACYNDYAPNSQYWHLQLNWPNCEQDGARSARLVRVFMNPDVAAGGSGFTNYMFTDDIMMVAINPSWASLITHPVSDHHPVNCAEIWDWTGTQEMNDGSGESTYRVDLTMINPTQAFRVGRVLLAGDGTPPWTSIEQYVAEGALANLVPAVHVSGKTAGLAYAGAIASGAGDLYVTTDSGATWGAASSPAHDFGLSLGGAFHFPWHDNSAETRYYWGALVDDAQEAHVSLVDSDTDISPDTGYGPGGPRAWSSCAQNRQILALMAYRVDERVIGVRSEDGGTTWSTLLTATAVENAYLAVHIADDPSIMYFWGPGGVAFSQASGAAVDDRLGNASTSEVMLIGGW